MDHQANLKQDPALGASNDAPGDGREASAAASDISATYSPEDNKLRLYALRRLDPDTYARVKAEGFAWAPKQGLFVAPKWTPSREDLAIELAGEIEPEQMTLAERAQAKAERLDALAGKRRSEANAFQRAANELSRAFEGGQPILIGHHSEAKARRTQDRMHSAMRNAVKSVELSNYWLYRAEGVECHANMKNDPRVRANRIRTLLAELRDLQRSINHAYLCLQTWDKLRGDDEIRVAVGDRIQTGSLAPFGLWSKVQSGEITPQAARERAIQAAQNTIRSNTRRRWIEHTLNRLSYEREMLGTVRHYEGELTETVLQAFAREHGAHKPVAHKVSDDIFVLESPVALPLHLANDTMIELSADDWRDLMHSVGYEVPAKKDAKPPILNLNVPQLQSRSRYHRGEIDTFPVVQLTKAEYGRVHAEQRGTRLSLCGEFRFKICPNPKFDGPRYKAGWAAVFLTDSKAHPLPASLTDDTEVGA